MEYEYSGYLNTLLDRPDPAVRDALEHIEFSADDLAQWGLVDDPAHREWVHIPATVERTGEGVLLQGHFEEVRRIDTLDRDDPSFWVPLSSLDWEDDRFPVDVSRYPIVEATYRCPTPWARPAWLWSYPGGIHFDGLQPARQWRTLARRIGQFGFPSQVDALTFRLYSTARSTEALEIQSVRFRAPSPLEADVCARDYQGLEAHGCPKSYPLLERFMPFGVYMNAGSAQRLAETMDISFLDYWRLALEDVARHHHNCVILEEVGQLTAGEWGQLLELAGSFGIRFVAKHEWPMEDFDAEGPALLDTHVRPYADSDAMLAWIIQDEPPEHTFQAHLKARQAMEKADPKHPLAVMMRDPNAFPLFARYFTASGMAHFKSHVPWELGRMIREHLPLSRGQQFWTIIPAFVWGTDTPEWNTCPEMRLMLNLACANGARGWFSFTYHNDPIWLDGHCQRSLTGPFLTFSDLWSELGHRMARLHTMAPLFLNSAPDASPGVDVEITWEEHPRSNHADWVDPIQWYWLRGEDYLLLYIVSNDISEVNSTYLKVPDLLPGRLDVYDLTHFVRTRFWAPMERQRHIEMFPGQGQIILLAPPDVCTYWRDVIAARILEGDRRQVAIDLELAQRYRLEAAPIKRQIPKAGSEKLAKDLLRMRKAREHLEDLIYAAPDLVEPRSKLIQASAAICGCDGALCRLLGIGKADLAHEWGLKILPLARNMAKLRLELRSGSGIEIHQRCVELAQKTMALLSDIRALS